MIWGRNARVGWKEEEEDPEEKLRDGEKRREKEGRRK